MRGYFFNAQPTADTDKYPSGFDREYDANDFNRFMGVFFTNGIFIYGNADACKVTASKRKLTITPGIVLVDGGQCHFEEGDGLTLDGVGLFSVMCRRNNSGGVRGFELVAVKGESAYPAPVREGDLWDLCLAHVAVTEIGETVTVTVVDTREDSNLCGVVVLTASPPADPTKLLPIEQGGTGASTAAAALAALGAYDKAAIDQSIANLTSKIGSIITAGSYIGTGSEKTLYVGETAKFMILSDNHSDRGFVSAYMVLIKGQTRAVPATYLWSGSNTPGVIIVSVDWTADTVKISGASSLDIFTRTGSDCKYVILGG